MELKQRKRRPGESLSSLLKDVRKLFTQAYPGPPNYMSEIAAKDAFVEALKDRELMIKVCEREPGTLDQAYKIAERMELYQRIPGGKDAEVKTKQPSKVRATATEDNSVLKSVVGTQRLMQKQLALITESLAKERFSSKKCDETEKTAVAKAKGRCHNCHELGHYRFECPTLVKKPSGATGTADATTRTIASDRKKIRLKTDRGSTSALMVAQKLSDQPLPTSDQATMEAWLDMVKRCPPPSISVGAPPPSETATWNRQTPSEQWKSYGSSTQHAQQSTQHAQQSTQHAQQLPEVHLDWSTQHAQQSTQHAQQLAEVRLDWPTQHAQQSTQHTQQSTQHAQQSTHLTQQLKPNTSRLSDTVGRSKQHLPWEYPETSTQHAQHTQETLQHAVESELPS